MACLLLDRLWPQQSAAAAKGGRRSVSFAGAPAPAARSTAAAVKGQADPLLWRSDALDRLAAALAAPEVLCCNTVTPSLLGRLLAGLGPFPLLGEAAVLTALGSLNQLLGGVLSPDAGDHYYNLQRIVTIKRSSEVTVRCTCSSVRASGNGSSCWPGQAVMWRHCCGCRAEGNRGCCRGAVRTGTLPVQHSAGSLTAAGHPPCPAPMQRAPADLASG
jgi:hypothetical protein